jgi:predicted amidophosphoribosyltransferase
VAEIVRGDWKALADGAEVDLSGDACPACGSALPLVEGACADCGLQLE